ncbi:MAG: hypothetical protein J6U87_05215 [Clostridia bacterium]|nr:hypothetical protein [Clostridia bacterium]
MENRTERRFLLLDVAIILLALFAALGVWQRDNLKSFFEKEEMGENYALTFEVKRVRSTTAELLQKDVAFYTEADGERVLLGTLVQSVAVSAATVYLPHPDPARGTVEAVYPLDEHEYLQDVSGELSCMGVENDGALFLGGTLLVCKGQQIAVQTETVDIVITVTDYQKIS